MRLLEMIEEVLSRADENTAVSVELVRKPLIDRKTGERSKEMVTRLQITRHQLVGRGHSSLDYTNIHEPLSLEYLEQKMILLQGDGKWEECRRLRSILVHQDADSEQPKGMGVEESSYFCRHCDKLIPGEPKRYKVDDLGILSGRRGTVTECRECGNQIDFWGMRA